MPDDMGLVERFRYRVNNPSAWDAFDQAASDDFSSAAAAIDRLLAERDEARKALTGIAETVEKSVRANGDEAFTLHLKGETYTGPAIEFLGYALTSLGKLARQALEDSKP